MLFTFDPANLFPGRPQGLENLRPKHYEFEAQKLKERDPQGKTKFYSNTSKVASLYKKMNLRPHKINLETQNLTSAMAKKHNEQWNTKIKEHKVHKIEMP